jgi:hypothetical protein
MKATINLELLKYAILYYNRFNYETLEAPYLVDKDINDITMPSGNRTLNHGNKVYVGSAEQSFYQLLKGGMKPEGNYMMLTPCHRDESYDDLHYELFLKLELISMDKPVIQDAYCFFTGCISNKDSIEIIDTEEGQDILVNGVEVGSYDARKINGQTIYYGTGLALPRFTQVLKNV